MSTSELRDIPIDQILPNPEQPRRHFDQQALEDLAQSIQQNGLLQPVVVERTDDPGQYILIAGERRWRAHRLAGIPQITAVVRPPLGANGDRPRERLLAALLENVQRVDMNAVEEARAFQRLHAHLKSYTKIAHRLGVSVPYVRNRIKLLDLDEEILELVADGSLQKDLRVVEALLSLPAEIRLQMARRVAKPGITIKAIQRACEKVLEELAKQDREPEPDEIVEPAVFYAFRRGDKVKIPLWEQLVKRQLVPAWHNVQEAAKLSCRACAFYDSPSEEICGECPAVLLIEQMIVVSREG